MPLGLRSFADLAAHLATLDADLELARAAILEKACRMVEKEAKRVLGTYSAGYNWPQLAESTQDDRVSKGYSANEPLLRTGELRASIEHVIEGNEGYVGTNDPVAAYHEFGTSRMPPRPFLSMAAIVKEKAIHEMADRIVAATVQRGGANYRELREILHIAKEAAQKMKELFDEFADEDDGRTKK
jgi:phage gpG-like protein